MKGKSGQDWNSRSNTKVRRGPKRTEDRIITPCWKTNKQWCWLSVSSALCLPPSPPCVLRQALQRRKTNQCSLVLPHPSLSLHLSVSSSEVRSSAVLHTEATTASCLSLSQTGARRQELRHHPALTGGKTPQRCSAAAQGIDVRTRVVSGRHGIC